MSDGRNMPHAPRKSNAVETLIAKASSPRPPSHAEKLARRAQTESTLYDLWHDTDRNHEDAPVLFTNLPEAGKAALERFDACARDLHCLHTPRFSHEHLPRPTAGGAETYSLILYLDPSGRGRDDHTRLHPAESPLKPLPLRQHSPKEHAHAERHHRAFYFDPVVRLLTAAGAARFAVKLYHHRGYTEDEFHHDKSGACTLEIAVDHRDESALSVLRDIHGLLQNRTFDVPLSKGYSL